MNSLWHDVEKGFQIAVQEAWEAYKNNTIPIGAAIMDAEGNLVTTGQNQVYTNGGGILKKHQLAHAEINAILELSEITDPNIRNHIRTFTLYSTMEPCPLCFGAIVMGSIRNAKFAARDSWAGATALNESIDYIKNKRITVSGPFEELETVQIALQTCYELQRGTYTDVLLPSWKRFCERGVLLGEHLHREHVLQDMIASDFGDVYDCIVTMSM
ncbi:MAG: nucleoside deaminase [Clostridia bacterium]|nr:nucleoside deaminase [Clostridia bacterium]